jgi:glycosyltransferase involved in cell wall biosynthesis
VLVTFRRPESLLAMLHALATQTRPLDRLIVVDNDPSPGARAVVEAMSPTAEYVAPSENLGPAGGIALGMERLLETAHDDDWILTLDDDDPPRDPTVLATLLAFAVDLAARDRSVGAVGADGARCDRRRGRMVWIEDRDLRGEIDVDWIGGDFLPVYSVRALRAVGPMQATLFFGFEELELGLRLRDAGYRIVVPGAICMARRAADHQLGLSVVPSRVLGELTWRRYYSLRNLIRILIDRGATAGAVRVTLVVGFAKPLVNVLSTPRAALRHLRMNIRACFDAWTGRIGRTVEPPR